MGFFFLIFLILSFFLWDFFGWLGVVKKTYKYRLEPPPLNSTYFSYLDLDYDLSLLFPLPLPILPFFYILDQVELRPK